MRTSSAAALAQSVEHWIVIPGVTGSIPVCRPKYYFADVRGRKVERKTP